MTQYIFANNVNTSLFAAITSTATSLTLLSATNLPTLAAGQIMPLTLNDKATRTVFEIVYVTAISGTNLTVIRGQEGTAAQNWNAGDYAYSTQTALATEAAIQSGAYNYAVDTGTTANAYVVALTPAIPTTIPDGFRVNMYVTAARVNTGAATLNGVAIVDRNGNPILGGQIKGMCAMEYSTAYAKWMFTGAKQEVSTLDFGADPTGVADSTAAFASASANTTNAVVPVGTYLFSSNVLLACSLELLPGAKLKPASGVTITLTAPFIAQDFQQIFDLSLGGNISISSSQPYLTPQHFGAVPGSDCTTAMQKSLAAAKLAACGWHFPNAQGLYKYNSSSPLQITTAISITNDGSATIDGTGSTGDCFQFQAGTYAGNKYDFPNVQNFTSGIAIRNLDGANEVFGKIGKISGCAGGISLETTTTAGGGTDTCVDNTYWFEQIDSCGFGTQLLAVDASSALQGNCFYGNFISRCTNSIYFNGPASVTPGWQGNYWEVQAIDGFSGTNSRGIYAPNGGINGQTVKCPTYFGGFSLEYINVGPNSNQNTFEVYFNSLADYTKLSINGIGNFVRPYGANATIRSVPLTAETASNSRSSFNGGNPVVDSTQTLSLAIPSLSAGATIDFYSYSPYTDGYSSKFWLQMIDSQGLIPITVEDASVVAGTDGNTVANQVHIRLMAVTAVTAHTALAILHTRTS